MTSAQSGYGLVSDSCHRGVILPNKPLQLTPHRCFQTRVVAFWHATWLLQPTPSTAVRRS